MFSLSIWSTSTGIFKNNKFRPTDKSTQVLVNNDFYLNKNKGYFVLH